MHTNPMKMHWQKTSVHHFNPNLLKSIKYKNEILKCGEYESEAQNVGVFRRFAHFTLFRLSFIYFFCLILKIHSLYKNWIKIGHPRSRGRKQVRKFSWTSYVYRPISRVRTTQKVNVVIMRNLWYNRKNICFRLRYWYIFMWKSLENLNVFNT